MGVRVGAEPGQVDPAETGAGVVQLCAGGQGEAELGQRQGGDGGRAGRRGHPPVTDVRAHGGLLE